MLDSFTKFLFLVSFTGAFTLLAWLLTERLRRDDERLTRIGSLKTSTERRAPKAPWIERFEQQIEDAIDAAGVNWTREQYLQRMALGIIAGIAIPWYLMGSLPAPILLIVIGIGAYLGYRSPRWWLERARRERQQMLHAQLPDILATLAATTHAGVSWVTRFQQGAAELPYPANEEFLKTYQAIQTGMSVDEALLDLQRRINSEDFDFVIQAIRLQLDQGGRLLGVFNTALRILRERVAVRRDVNTKLASARATSVIGTIMPLALLSIMRLSAPDMTEKLFTTVLGQVAMLIGVGFWALGQWIIRRMSASVRY